jgi:hypothetical protein
MLTYPCGRYHRAGWAKCKNQRWSALALCAAKNWPLSAPIGRSFLLNLRDQGGRQPERHLADYARLTRLTRAGVADGRARLPHNSARLASIVAILKKSRNPLDSVASESRTVALSSEDAQAWLRHAAFAVFGTDQFDCPADDGLFAKPLLPSESTFAAYVLTAEEAAARYLRANRRGRHDRHESRATDSRTELEAPGAACPLRGQAANAAIGFTHHPAPF